MAVRMDFDKVEIRCVTVVPYFGYTIIREEINN